MYYRKKSQASLEYLIVFSLAFVLLLPMIYLFYEYSMQFSQQINTNAVAVIGNDIINAAESVFYMGRGSRLTLEVTMPDGVKNISILYNWDKNINEFVFELFDSTQMAFFSNVNINGTFDKTAISQGLKNIRVEAVNNSNYDYVQVDIY